MHKVFLFVMVFIAIPILSAQAPSTALDEGDLVTLDIPLGSEYQHLDFPRKNIIIKRGAIPNFNNLIGEKLVVARILTDKYGRTRALLKRKDGLNFFRFYPSVTADLEKALADGEIKAIRKDSIAQ